MIENLKREREREREREKEREREREREKACCGVEVEAETEAQAQAEQCCCVGKKLQGSCKNKKLRSFSYQFRTKAFSKFSAYLSPNSPSQLLPPLPRDGLVQ
jgi:hypothetical protein